MTPKLNWRIGLAVIALPVVAACSETSVLDAFDSGNRGGDNAAIVSNQPLSVPPDLSLPRPGAANAPAYSGNGLQVEQGQRAPGLTPQSTPPVQQQQAYQAPPPPGDPTAGVSNNGVQNKNPADEPYIRHGINPYNPDGTRKKQSVLDQEARAKKVELERAKNPSYGTVFNSGDLWSTD